MTNTTHPPHAAPSPWSIVLAFTIIYLSWGTTYLAIKEGVATLPPCLFGGTRILLAGLILFVYLLVRGQSIRLPRPVFWRMALGGAIMFVGGNGLINVAEKTEASGVAAVLVATTPLWMALLEAIFPWGERITFRGWLGVICGLAGVLVLLAPKLEHPATLLRNTGPLLVLGSSFAWAVGSFILRHGQWRGNPVVAAAYQMIVGGAGLTLVGLSLGEHHQLTPEAFTPNAVFAFFYLLLIGSLLGYVAYSWLLNHVSATMAGTYAYVNPVVAIYVGWLFADESITVWIIAGMVIILAGVALVRTGGVQRVPTTAPSDLPKQPKPTPRPSSVYRRLVSRLPQ